MTFVLPKLVTVFEDANLKIPLTTRVIFAISRTLAFKPSLTIIVFIILAIGLVFLLRNRQVRKSLNQFLFHLPVISNLLKQVELTRFARTLGNLLKSGLPIIEALGITADGLTLKEYQDVVSSAKDEVAKGVSLANAFRKKEKIIPGLLISVIQVGEKTAELDEMLLNIADFYEEQVDNSLKSMASLIEPILLVIVGLAIGLVAVSIIVPIYQLMGAI
jgi:type II secretory pathway component PulF